MRFTNQCTAVKKKRKRKTAQFTFNSYISFHFNLIIAGAFFSMVSMVSMVSICRFSVFLFVYFFSLFVGALWTIFWLRFCVLCSSDKNKILSWNTKYNTNCIIYNTNCVIWWVTAEIKQKFNCVQYFSFICFDKTKVKEIKKKQIITAPPNFTPDRMTSMHLIHSQKRWL